MKTATEVSDIQLIFPPQCMGNLQGPHLGIPLLATYLRANGYAADTLDLNLRFFRHIASRESLVAQLGRFRERREALAARQSLTEAELKELLELQNLDETERWLSALFEHRELRDMAEFERCQFLVDPMLDELPKDFEDIVRFVTEGRPTVVTQFYDGLDIVRQSAAAPVIGLSVAFHVQLYPALELARRIKSLRGDEVNVVVGGSQISLMAGAQHEALARLPYIDAVIVYEGEAPLRRICEQVRAGSGLDFSAVPNAYFQRGADVVAPSFSPPVGIDALPTPEFDDVALSSYLQPVYLPVYVSKGCYWGKCKFCDYTKLYTPGQAKTHAWAVFRPVDTLVADIGQVSKRHGIERVFLISDAISPKYYRQLSESVIASGLEVEFLSYCRVEKTYDLAFFKLLHRAGVRHLIFGVEATDDRILKLIDKGNTVRDVRRSIRYATVAGINVIFNLIPDYPTITVDEVERTLGFIRDNIDFIYRLNCHFFNLSANSSIVEEADEHGITVETDRYVQTNHGVHSLGFTREAGLTPDQAARVRTVFGLVTADIELYRRTRHLLATIRHENFSWHSAEFVLADEVQLYRVPFDPARSTMSQDGPIFAQQQERVDILASPPTKRYLRVSATLRAILEVAERQAGFFTLHDVLTSTAAAEQRSGGSFEPVLQTVQTLLEEGFIRSVYHPWLGDRPRQWAGALLTDGGPGRVASLERREGPARRRMRWRVPESRELLRSTAMLAAVDRAITDRDVEISDEELQRSANAFRASLDLHSAADTRAWLEASGMTVDDLETFVSRCVAVEKLRSRSHVEDVR